jgi:8-oxo-dGTP pyrophosphatase MutT (NUDIX family)
MSERFLTREAVYVVCWNDKNEILLELREGTGYLDGHWDLPSGHVEAEEGILEAAVRELKEEVNLTVDPKDLKLIHIVQRFVDFPYIDFVLSAAKFTDQPKIMEADKCGDLRWFPTNALPKKQTSILKTAAKNGFSDELAFSVMKKADFDKLMKGVK